MQHRELGGQGLRVSAMGLGAMRALAYGDPDDEESLATTRRALELGVNFLDTADVYGSGRSEELLGRAIKGRRDGVVVASKFGNILGPDGSYAAVNGRPEFVKSACDRSLRRLGVEVIDLYYQHRVDRETPIEETVGAMADLVGEGKVRFLGLSEAGADTIRRGHATHPISAVQTEYSLWSRDVEQEILPTCRELGIGFVAYSPLGRGFLTGKIRDLEADLRQEDARRKFPRFQEENFRQNLQLVDRLSEFANEKSCTLAQLALAWILAQGDHVVPIPSTKHRAYLEENVGALDISLSPEDLGLLDKMAPPGVASGARYHEVGMTKLGL